MADIIQFRRDTLERWSEFNPTLAEGEIGFVLDSPNQYKVGDGVHAWNDLPIRGFNGNIVNLFTDDEEQGYDSVMSLNGLSKIFKYIVSNGSHIDVGNDWTILDELNNTDKCGFYILMKDKLPYYHMMITGDNGVYQWIFGNLLIEEDGQIRGNRYDGAANIVFRKYNQNTWSDWKYLQDNFISDGETTQIFNDKSCVPSLSYFKKVVVEIQTKLQSELSTLESNINNNKQEIDALITNILKKQEDLTTQINESETAVNNSLQKTNEAISLVNKISSKVEKITTLNGIIDYSDDGVGISGIYLIRNSGGKLYEIREYTDDSYTVLSPSVGNIYTYNGIYYGWNGKIFAPIGGGSGTGSGTGNYNITTQIPLDDGNFYTLETALSALRREDIDNDLKKGFVITFEESAGNWLEYRFVGTNVSDFYDKTKWEEYGGAQFSTGQKVGDIGIDDKPTAESENLVKSGGVAKQINQIEQEINKLKSVEIINDLSTGGADKALSAEMGKEIWDSVSAVIELSRDITSKFSMIQGKQAYGNVGQSINFGDLPGAEYTVIDIEGVYVSFKSLPGDTRLSSYLQYTNSDDIIIDRKFVNIGNNIKCEEFIKFPEGATKCYVTVATGTLSVIKKEKEGELTKRVNSIEPSVNKYLINKTSTIDVVEDATSEYTITKGSQAYGNVGSAISIGIQSILEYVVIDTEGVVVEFMSEERAIGVSSYLQYVDSNGIIIERDFINIGVGVACKTTIIFPEGAVRAYVTGNKGTIRIFKSSSVLVSQFEEIKHKMNNLPTVGKLEDITIADNPDSIVDAINKGCTLSMGDVLILNKQEIFNKWGIASANNKFITGTVGSKISLLKGQDIRNIKIPVKDGDIITYPMFKTSQNNGSFLIDSNNIVLEAFINDTKPDRTLGTVEVNGYGSKEVYFYMSLYPYSLITQDIIIKNANSEYVEIPINKYLLELLSNDYKSNVSENKALTTIGALRLYEELSDKIKGNNLLFPCKDYGVMPSCLYGDSEAFLQDGVDSGGNAIIKYADVIAKYDELVTAYPNYIKKKELGFDASGTIPMYAYTLEPKYPTQSIYLQAGVHGWEPDPVFALAMITTLIANAYGTTSGDGLKVDDNALKFIRENVKVTIVPCVNPYGFNNRADCGIDKRAQAQNNANGVNLNGAWNGNAAEAVAVRTLIESIKDELSFAIDMHSTVWVDSRSRYGCFYGGVNEGSASLLTAFKTYEWLYKFYNIKYPSIVQGDSVPNPLGDGYASIGTMTGTFNSWIYSTYGIESTTMEFSDHVWTSELHTSVAMSVAVNMYLNQFIQHICARFKTITPKVESTDIYPAKG